MIYIDLRLKNLHWLYHMRCLKIFPFFSLISAYFLYYFHSNIIKTIQMPYLLTFGWSDITCFHIIQFLTDELYLINIIFSYSKVPEKYNKSCCNLCHNLNHAIILHESIHKDYVYDQSNGTCHKDLAHLLPDRTVCYDILEGDGAA